MVLGLATQNSGSGGDQLHHNSDSRGTTNSSIYLISIYGWAGGAIDGHLIAGGREGDQFSLDSLV